MSDLGFLVIILVLGRVELGFFLNSYENFGSCPTCRMVRSGRFFRWVGLGLSGLAAHDWVYHGERQAAPLAMERWQAHQPLAGARATASSSRLLCARTCSCGEFSQRHSSSRVHPVQFDRRGHCKHPCVPHTTGRQPVASKPHTIGYRIPTRGGKWVV